MTTPIVETNAGRIAGAVDRGVRVFKGIPYAAPPVGKFRWQPPQPVTPWAGVRDAFVFGAECPQTPYWASAIYERPQQPQSEDCLFLNVWTTAAEGDNQPVLVWIHGGALIRGSGISDIRDGVPFAKKGVVLVSINYRLGPLGYLAHPALTAESSHQSSGNYGVLDQIAALQWVQRNIERFGGDPSRVTIAGESAGAWSVNTLLASPLAKGLFARAIGQSGGRFSRTPYLNKDRGSHLSAENVGVAFAKALGVDSLAALRSLPAERLLDVADFRTRENVDGWVLPDEIGKTFAEHKHNNVPVIVGSNADEMTAFGVDPASYDVERDKTFSSHMRNWARATVAAGSRAYLYFFSYVPPHPRAAQLKAYHTGEIPYVFNVIPSSDPREAGFRYTDVDTQLAEMMSSYWANFISRGDPNGADLPAWLPYDLESEPYMEFGSTVRSGNHLLKTELDALESALNRPR